MVKVCYIPSKEKLERQEALKIERQNATQMYGMFNLLAGFQSLKWFLGFMGISTAGSAGATYIFFYIAIIALIIAKALPDKKTETEKKGK